MDQGTARHCSHLVDGRHALSAAAVRLSLRGGGRLEAIRDVQGDGTTVAQGHHQSGNDRDLARWTLSRVERTLVLIRLAECKARTRNPAVGCPRIFFPLC